MSNVNKLPDSYVKDGSSNNYKLLNINEQAIADAKTDAQALFDMLDLGKATGRTLDLYGDMIGQKRGLLTDKQYYHMILTKLAKNAVKGDYYSTIDALCIILDCERKRIILGDSEKPCKVNIVSFPVSGLVFAGFSSRQAITLVESILPIGITVDESNFDGTFEFTDTEYVYNEEEGFADIEQTIGGHLGLLLGDDDTIPILPI